jgi:HEAT repeat protein/Na+/melibiose symporter-like transporter
LSPPAPNRIENLRSLRYANVDVAFFTAFSTLVTGIFLVGFIQDLGGSDLWIGLLSSIPSLVGLLQIPGAIWGRSFGSFKRFVTPGGFLNRLIYVPLVALPLAPFPDGLKLTLLMTCVLLASIASTIIGPIYNDWIAELVPANSRGTYFARRNAISTAVGAIIGIAGAYVLDVLRNGNQERLGFTVVFALAVVCAWISFAFFARMQDLPRPNPIRNDLRTGLKAIGRPFGDVQFRRVLIFLAVFTVGQSFAGNLFGAYARESLHLDFKVIQMTAVGMAVGNVLTARFWGFFSDRYGNKPCLIILGILVGTNPIFWLVTRPGASYNAPLLIGGHVWMGVIWAGIALCQFNILLATADREDRANYLGAGMALMAIVGGVSPLIGASLMSLLRGPFSPEIAYKLVFGVAMLFRLLSVLFLVPVHEAGARTVRTALDDLRRVTPRGVRAMRSLARSASVETREEAIASVGQTGATLATDEILKALHDPQPRVRRQAATALARLQDPRATTELIHQIEDHPDLLEEEVIDTLGVLGNPAAIPALIRTMQNPRSALRRAAARALGRVGGDDPAACAALEAAAVDPTDVDLRRSALQALRLLGSRSSIEVIRAGANDPHPSVRIAAAEAIAELELRETAPDVRRSLAAYDDEASSEMAYALGAVGEESDIPAILTEAVRSNSMITRRRCLLGIARVLGVEAGAYRLLLREGMERDATIMELLKRLGRRSPRVQVALERYAAGDEPGALNRLARALNDPVLAQLAAQPVEELFLVASVVAVRRSQG